MQNYVTGGTPWTIIIDRAGLCALTRSTPPRRMPRDLSMRFLRKKPHKATESKAKIVLDLEENKLVIVVSH